MQAAARSLLDDEDRLGHCYRTVIRRDDGVKVWRRPTTSTYYRGLRVCGMVWACPVCAAKVAERRRAELVQAMDAHKAAGGSVLLMTLTVPHTREDEPFSLLSRLLKAYTAFGGGKRAWKSLLPGVVGSVRALEVTHGQANGWHPHLHVLVFLAGEVDPATWTPVLLDQWAKVTKRHKLGEVNAHGLRLDDGSKAADYASKWGLEDEMTKAHLKQARKNGSRTPWALLADYAAGDKRAGQLFIEFFSAFRGKHQLGWSRGLRAHFGLGVEKTDEQLAAERVEAEDLLVASISLWDWSLIRKHNLRGHVLELLRAGTWETVDMLLSHYRPPKRDAREATHHHQEEETGARRAQERGKDDEQGTAAETGQERQEVGDGRRVVGGQAAGKRPGGDRGPGPDRHPGLRPGRTGPGDPDGRADGHAARACGV